MARKLNRKAAEAYSKNFSANVVDEYFANRKAATGQDILEFTPVQQINLLLIQRLYVRWQEDTLRLRSPYFNYEHPQVQESLQQFMNTLSRHILVEQPALQPLLEEAVMDSLRLLLQPMAYFDDLLRRYPQRETLQSSLRYLRWQEPITAMLQEQLEHGEITDPDFLLTLLDASIKSGKLELDAIDEHLGAYEQVLPIPLELVDEPAAEAPTPAREAEEGDFFSAITRSAPKPPKPAPAQAPQAQPPRPTIRQEPVADSQPPQPPAPAAATPPVATAPDPQPTQQSAPRNSPPAAAPAPKPAEESKSLNTRFERSEKKPLYEKFEQKESRGSIMQKPRSASIRNYITLNQRFMFVKELFGGDGGAFNAALEALDACQNRTEAQQWVQEHLAAKSQWQEQPEVAEEFEGVLDHRFGSN